MKIAIGGMIASGKSTLVDNLSKTLNIPAMKEFESDDVVFNTILKWLYEGVKDVEMLLQFYFLHNHWSSQKEYKDSVIVDKHIIENLIFAQEHLSHNLELLNIYEGLFSQYVKNVHKPDLYIILEIDWNTFKERINQRGRQQEIDNFDNNTEYFKRLLSTYVSKLVEQCEKQDITYYVLNTSQLSEEETLKKSLDIVDRYL